jgi:hypothetical protein
LKRFVDILVVIQRASLDRGRLPNIDPLVDFLVMEDAVPKHVDRHYTVVDLLSREVRLGGLPRIREDLVEGGKAAILPDAILIGFAEERCPEAEHELSHDPARYRLRSLI